MEIGMQVERYTNQSDIMMNSRPQSSLDNNKFQNNEQNRQKFDKFQNNGVKYR